VAGGVRIPVLPLAALTREGEALLGAAPENHPFANDGMAWQAFGPTGRWLLAGVLASLGLRREDEIAILTTSGETYVSVCVSVTAFNHARISRMVTPATRVVILIHEFGYVLDGAAAWIARWQADGITVIEDCAHVMGLTVDGAPVGGLGDFALYSLPKLIPVDAGGVLRARRPLELPALSTAQGEAARRAAEAAATYLPKIGWLNQRRLENAAAIERHLPRRFARFRPSRCAIPWLFGFLSPEREAVAAATPEVEWGSTLRADLLYLSTNPLIAPEIYGDLFGRPPFA
jgi:DegT/DnrJ/EryC1/StrS aminotransferase family